jgi:hypothetical protein
MRESRRCGGKPALSLVCSLGYRHRVLWATGQAFDCGSAAQRCPAGCLNSDSETDRDLTETTTKEVIDAVAGKPIFPMMTVMMTMAVIQNT